LFKELEKVFYNRIEGQGHACVQLILPGDNCVYFIINQVL